MSDFYTNVLVRGSKIYYRGIEDSKRVIKKINYNPTLYLSSKEPSKYTTIHGDWLEPIQPGNLYECRSFVEKYKGVDGFSIFGNQKHEYTFIAEEFPDEVDWDISNIQITFLDIEVGSESGFPEPTEASEPVTAITIKKRNRCFVFGCGDFNNSRGDVTYIKCDNEHDLLQRFLHDWSHDYPDIIVGWHSKFFDIPYLVNRITKLLGEDVAKKLSPWNDLYKRTINLGMGKTEDTYVIIGIAHFDYIELYKKFSAGGSSQESYRLDYIASVEIGERKLSYSEYGNLHTLYRENYQLFIEYNIRDVELIEKIDDKLRLIELALTLAYDSKCNYDDVFTQVRMWDSIIYNHLLKSNVILPPTTEHRKDSAYIGAYVKDPTVGMHKWIASFDLNSLYPHLIIQYNISPDTFIEPSKYTPIHHEILNKSVSVDSLLNKEIDLSNLKDETITPNGQFFSIKKQGFLSEIMEQMYNDRSSYKKKAMNAKKELEKETDPSKKEMLKKQIARYNNLQLAKKVALNSAYGALGNEFFRFFDVRQASAITTSGQLSIKWIEKKLNEYMNKILKTEETDYVLASDTDSIYLSLDGLVRQTILEKSPGSSTKEIIKFMDKVCDSKIQPFIDKSYNELSEYTNAYGQKMIMKREALADKGIWVAKKRYILSVYNNEGIEYAEPQIKVMGLEMIKSSTPSACREKLWKAIDIILKGTENDAIRFITDFKEEFRKSKIEDIAFPRSINGLGKYGSTKSVFIKGCPIHVRGSLIYNKLLKEKKLNKKYPPINEGEKIKFIYLLEPNPIHSHVISFPSILPPEFEIEKYIDYDTQYQKSFVEALKLILDAIGWKTERINTLESYFG